MPLPFILRFQKTGNESTAKAPQPKPLINIPLTRNPDFTLPKLVAGKPGGGGGNTPQPPTREYFDSNYKTDTTKWRNVPWGSALWTEGGNNLKQDLDLDMPTGSKPNKGWPVVIFFHANGSTKTIPASGALADAKAACLAAGFAFMSVEFRHPVVNVSLGAPHTDVGFAVQYARAMAPAFELDVSNYFGMAKSRGSLCLWQSMQPDMRDGKAGSYQARMSSLLKGIWTHAAQTTYSTTEFANLFIVAGAQRTAFLTAYPDDNRWGSALQSIVTQPSAGVPHLNIRHADAYPVGLVNANQVNEHYSGFGAAMRDAYIAKGLTSKVTASPSIADANAWSGMVAWYQSLLA